jgi:hypothetical protein
MECHFISDGRVVLVENLLGLTEAEAIEKSESLFHSRAHALDGFEIRNLGSLIHEYVEQVPIIEATSWFS